MPAAAAIVAATAITTGFQLSEAAKARRYAKDQADEQKKKQAALDQQLKDKTAVTALTESYRQSKGLGVTGAGYTKGGTLLTGSFGVPAAPPAAGGKTLLGT